MTIEMVVTVGAMVRGSPIDLRLELPHLFAVWWPLDTDHPGARLGQQERRQWARQSGAQIQNGHVRKRRRGFSVAVVGPMGIGLRRLLPHTWPSARARVKA